MFENSVACRHGPMRQRPGSRNRYNKGGRRDSHCHAEDVPETNQDRCRCTSVGSVQCRPVEGWNLGALRLRRESTSGMGGMPGASGATVSFSASGVGWMLKIIRNPIAPPGVDVGPGLSSSPLPPFEDICKRYFDFVWSSARHLGAREDFIDDVVQDVFIVIHSKRATLQRPEALRSWIYGVVRRVMSDYRRSKRTRDAAGATLGAELKLSHPCQPSPLEMAERNCELDLLESILADLDEPKREIFVMVEILEMTVPEVVRVLDIPLNTAYSRLRMARQSFEQALAGQEARDEENRRPCRTLGLESR